MVDYTVPEPLKIKEVQHLFDGEVRLHITGSKTVDVVRILPKFRGGPDRVEFWKIDAKKKSIAWIRQALRTPKDIQAEINEYLKA